MDAVQRAHLIAWYRRNRARTRATFDVLADDATYYCQPIALRHPIVFYVYATFRCARDLR